MQFMKQGLIYINTEIQNPILEQQVKRVLESCDINYIFVIFA